MVFKVMNQDSDSRTHPCVSSEGELEMYYLEEKIPRSPLLFALGVSISGSIRLCFGFSVLEDFNSYFPYYRGRKKKPTPTTETVAVRHLFCNDLPGLLHPESQVFVSPLKKFCLHLKLSVKTM